MCNLLMVSKKEVNLLEKLSNKVRSEVHYRHFDDMIAALKAIPTREESILVLDCDDLNDYSNKSLFISPYYKNLHIIGLTSDDSLENIRTMKERNISKIILKPVNNERFEGVIKNILEQKNILAQKSIVS